MIRKSKKYSRPRKPFDKIRIEEENQLREKYGLKNKKEIWKADAAIGRIRNLAKQLITKSDEEKQGFIERLRKKGFKVESLAEVLALNKENWLKRRLQTVVHIRKLVNTPKQARQMVTHKHISINGRTVNIPSYMVSLEEEPNIELKIVLKNPVKGKSKIEEIKEDMEKKEFLDKTIKEEQRDGTQTEESPKAPVELLDTNTKIKQENIIEAK